MNRLIHWLLAIFIIVDAATQRVQGSEVNPTNIIPVITMEAIPFLDAVRFMARQGQINYMVDPALSESTNVIEPVNIRWEALTARTAFERLLADRHLHLIENPQTTVAKISDVKTPAVKFPNALVSGTNGPIPSIRFNDIYLGEALAKMALAGNIPVKIEPQLFDTGPLVSAQWNNVTARQAFAALCENYNLKVTQGTNAVFKISQNTPADLSPK